MNKNILWKILSYYIITIILSTFCAFDCMTGLFNHLIKSILPFNLTVNGWAQFYKPHFTDDKMGVEHDFEDHTANRAFAVHSYIYVCTHFLNQENIASLSSMTFFLSGDSKAKYHFNYHLFFIIVTQLKISLS